MSKLRVGIQLASLRQPLKQAVATAARIGADAVEVDARGSMRPQEMSRTAIRQFRKMLDDYGLRVSAVAFRTRRGYGAAEGLEQRVEATKRAMTFAYELGSSVVTNYVGVTPEPLESPEGNLLIAALSDLGRHGHRCGAQLAARTGLEPGSQLQNLIQALPPGSLAVDFDPGTLLMNGFSADDASQVLAESIVHVHVKDGVRDLAQGRGLEVPLGRGSVDFFSLMGRLEERGFRGFWTIERESADQPILEMEQAIQFLRNLTD